MPINPSLSSPLCKEREINEYFSPRVYVDSKISYFIIKRLLDITASLFIICFLLSWLIPIIALLIKLDSSGPVFFLQKRIGRGGRTFICFKFRTMILNSESDQKPAETNDIRITRVGKFLRETNLDEFPQFLNVFLGKMSLIGPRPHMYWDCNKFSSLVKGYKIRNLVKPGITGLAQIRGYHGPAVTPESILKRFQWDAFYVRNANFWLDMRIIRITIVQRTRILFYLTSMNSPFKTPREEYPLDGMSKGVSDGKKIIFTRFAKNFFRAGVKIIMLLRSTNN